jgi:hypothetical protein
MPNKRVAYIIISVIFNLIIIVNGSAQQALKFRGKVIDERTREILPFVHISYAEAEKNKGNISDIDGKFEIEISDIPNELIFSYIGYEKKIIKISDLTDNENVIELKESFLDAAEVLVYAGENPAYRIIRNATKNKKNNNPENYQSFSYDCYNKVLVYDQQNAPREISNKSDTVKTLSDSTLIPFYYMLMESVTSRKFIYPDRDYEEVLTSKVSGLKQPGFAPLATAFQPFSFYEDIIFILNKEYINPISEGSINRYEFRLEDTLFNQTDTTFILKFFPRKGKNFDALTGLLYINTNGFAVEYVVAEPAEKALLDIKFEQKYSFHKQQKWFPEQLNFELKMNPYRRGWFTFQGKSYLSNVKINSEEISKDKIKSAALYYDDKQSLKNIELLNHYRVEKLNGKEILTYRVIDSLGNKIKMDNIMKLTEDANYGLISVGPVSFDINKILDYNPFEGYRIGMGLYTSTSLSKSIKIGGYFGYGFGDKRIKYGADFIANISPSRDIIFQIHYENDVAEPAAIFNNSTFLSRQITVPETFARRYILNRLDYKNGAELSFHFRLFKSLQIRPFAEAFNLNSTYGYAFLDSGVNSISNHNIFKTGLSLRWTFKEKYALINGQKSLFESRYPAIYLNYEKGITIENFSDYSFNKITFGFYYHFFTKGLGKTSIDLHAGLTDRSLPYSLLFNGRGSYSNELNFFNRNTFQTMDFTEFISDRFVYFFFIHNFGRLPFKSEIFRPELKLIQAVGWGSLKNPQNHLNIAFKTMEKGYYESGLMLDNLICLKIANMAYGGAGVGVFYRYGPYALGSFQENIAIKFSLNISI